MDLDAIELRPSLREILAAEGHTVAGEDFLEWHSSRQYDRVLKTNRAVGFRSWLGEMEGELTALPEDAFHGADAFRRTGVSLHKLSDRFIRRCEVQRCDATSDAFPRRPGGRRSQGVETGDRTGS